MLTDNVARKLQEMRPSNAPLLTCLSCNLRAGRIHLHSQGSEVFLTRTRATLAGEDWMVSVSNNGDLSTTSPLPVLDGGRRSA